MILPERGATSSASEHSFILSIDGLHTLRVNENIIFLLIQEESILNGCFLLLASIAASC